MRSITEFCNKSRKMAQIHPQTSVLCCALCEQYMRVREQGTGCAESEVLRVLWEGDTRGFSDQEAGPDFLGSFYFSRTWR